ncbi:sodium:solute symporter family protein [Lactobacillus xujianguonis]|uniref:sodium:solute symporter family protein n=1 Tax=Lactobacillus xujianguonis TaxID=2495899 RepID=UPI000FDCD955|nr:sodium:solute symporter family protein [Lactobacillus xujianguonis]RVU73931.1 sodium:solute symporter family protein [Lactobacillus xujianguonis]
MSIMNPKMSIIILAVVVIYIVITSYLSYKWSGHSNSDFMQGGKGIPYFVVAVMLFSNYNGIMAVIGTAQRAYTSGFAAAWSVFAAAIGFFLYGMFFVKRLYKTGSFTISGAVKQKYGRSTQIIVSLIMIYAMLMLNLNTYFSGASVLHEILGTNLPISMIIIAVVSTIYFSIGGMKSVAKTTVIHTFFKYCAVLIVLAVALVLSHNASGEMIKLPSYYYSITGKVGWGTIIGWILTSTGAIFSTQFIAQAIASTPSAKDAQKASFWAAFLVIPFGIGLGLIGVYAKMLFPHINPLYALPVFLGHMNVALASITAIGLLASVFIGVSACSLAIVALVVDDFYVPHWKPEEHAQLKVTKIISVIVGFLPLIFMFMSPNILALSFFAKALRVSIAIVAVLAFYLPSFRNTTVANIALIGTTILTTVWYLLGDPFGINDTYIAIFTPLIVMLIGRLFNKKEKVV